MNNRSLSRKEFIDIIVNQSQNKIDEDFLTHHGVLDMKWKVRRYQPYPRSRSISRKEFLETIVHQSQKKIENNYLAHYGVKGMKWGTRKKRSLPGTNKISAEQRYELYNTLHKERFTNPSAKKASAQLERGEDRRFEKYVSRDIQRNKKLLAVAKRKGDKKLIKKLTQKILKDRIILQNEKNRKNVEAKAITKKVTAKKGSATRNKTARKTK